MQATYARKSFPCFDEPAMKAIFNITIIHDRETVALSNGRDIGLFKKRRNPVLLNPFVEICKCNKIRMKSNFLLGRALKRAQIVDFNRRTNFQRWHCKIVLKKISRCC